MIKINGVGYANDNPKVWAIAAVLMMQVYYDTHVGNDRVYINNNGKL